jgi:hypothetical protein
MFGTFYIFQPVRFTLQISPNEHYNWGSHSYVSLIVIKLKKINYTPWPESASELYRLSDRLLSAKSVTTFVERGCRVISATDPYGRILGFLDRRRYFFFQVAPQLYSRGWVDPVPDPLLLRKSGSFGNRAQTYGSVARNSDHQTT